MNDMQGTQSLDFRAGGAMENASADSVVLDIPPAIPQIPRWHAMVKRGEDFVLALLLLILGSPLLIGIAVAIKIDSSGPILFRQRRRGLKGTPFNCLKFRTMYNHTSDFHCLQQTERDDPRVTRVGRFLRKRSLDELPQLLNVLRGEMSLVGPRPHALGTSIDGKLLEHHLDAYMLRYHVKPGITGWAQVNGSRGPLDTPEKLRNRVALDIYYINNWSLFLDLKIVVRTLFCLIGDKDAF